VREFETQRDLGAYYTRQGFTVLPPRQAIDVGTLLAGVPVHLTAGPGETFFYGGAATSADREIELATLVDDQDLGGFDHVY
jgi:hypothetical protein